MVPEFDTFSITRRSGDEWFVGSITNNDARDTKIDFSFLTPGKKYKATVYYNDPSSSVRTHVSIKTIKLDASSKLDFHLLASGGNAIWIKPL